MDAVNWDRAAAFYDWQLWLETTTISAAVDLAAPGADDRVLDVATGTGAILRAVAPLLPRELVGVDRSPAMLAKAPAQASLHEADATALPFDDAGFDVVFASYLLHVLPADDRALVISELRRVVAPGGRVVTVTPSWRTDPRPELGAAGLRVVASRRTWLGYPSLVALMRPLDG